MKLLHNMSKVSKLRYYGRVHVLRQENAALLGKNYLLWQKETQLF